MRPFIRLCLILISTNLWAVNEPTSWYALDANKKAVLNVSLFLSSTCPHCHKADAFFKEIEPKTPWLHVQRYVVNEDKNALIRFNSLLYEQHMDDFAVPSVFFCNSRWVGFDSDATTGKDLLKGLNYCKQELEKKGILTAEAVSVLKRWANANMFDTAMIEQPSRIQYTSLMGMMDGINPCAYFVFAGFLGLLFMQDSKRGRLVVGSIFILGMAIVHYILQVYTSLVFEWLLWLRVPAVLVGVLALFVLREYYMKRSISSLFYLLAFLLALIIPAYQQTCVMNWSFIFQKWLLNQSMSPNQTALYQLLYQVMHIVPMTLLLILYWAFSSRAYFQNRNELFNTIGMFFILSIALLLIIYPIALSHFLLSFFTVGLLSVSGWIVYHLKNK